MKEIEFKVAIENPDFYISKLNKDYNCLGSVVKNDLYFGNESEELFRIRKEVWNNNEKDVKYIVTYKDKNITDGIESNNEIEFNVSSVVQFSTFAKKLGYKPLYKKKKISHYFKKDNFNIEVVEVESLGWFIECEILVDNDDAVENAKKTLNDFLVYIGKNKDDLVTKYYSEMLQEKKIKTKSSSIEIYTDGGCSGNPGVGAWSFVLIADKEYVKSGKEEWTTNNRMELRGVIEALKASADFSPENIVLTTDSTYVKDGITKWIFNWKKNGWKTADKKDVKNVDLWQELDLLSNKFKIEWKWVKGHSGNKYNEICDSTLRDLIKKSK